MAEDIHLTNQEATDLVLSILEGVAAIEDGAPLDDTWSAEMRDWCLLILRRSEEGGTST